MLLRLIRGCRRGARRSGSASSSHHESGRQCHQIHRAGRGRSPCAAGSRGRPDVVLQSRCAITGIGNRAEKHRQIFEAFSQPMPRLPAASAHRLRTDDLQRLVAMMHGQLSVESAPGQGSIFQFTARFMPSMEAPPADSADTREPSPASAFWLSTTRGRKRGQAE